MTSSSVGGQQRRTFLLSGTFGERTDDRCNARIPCRMPREQVSAFVVAERTGRSQPVRSMKA